MIESIVKLGLERGYLKAINIDNERQAFSLDERDEAEKEAAVAIAAALLLMRESLINESMTLDEIRQAPQQVRDNTDGLKLALVALLIATSDIGANSSADRLAQNGLYQDTGRALTTANAEAIRRASTAVDQIADTLTKQLRDTIEAWIESGQPIDALIERLDTIIFSETRAEMIATTEGTTGYRLGAVALASLAGVAILEWYTMQDERVCLVCKPMNGKKRFITGSYDPDLPVQDPPPAHPRCRCGEREIVKSIIP
jgi:SPP1 gp7 family putative phage head morphogenesis protein